MQNRAQEGPSYRLLGLHHLGRRNYPAATVLFVVLGREPGEGFETRTPPMPRRLLSGSAPLFVAAAVILAFVIVLWWLA